MTSRIAKAAIFAGRATIGPHRSAVMAVPLWMAAATAAAGGAAYLLSPGKKRPAPEEVPDEGDELEEAAAEAAGALDSAEGHGGADDRGAAAAKKQRKAIKFGKMDARWAARCSRDTIGADLALGCGCREGCSDRLTTAMVVQERSEQAGKDGADRRHMLRVFLESNVSISSRLGFNLHPECDSSIQLCPPAFDLLKGYGAGYTYRMIRSVKNGEGDDDQVGRGNGGDADGFADDSLQTMVSGMSVEWYVTVD